MSTAEKRRYSAKEYLAMERTSEIRHQYDRGKIDPMPQGDCQHTLLVSNLAFSLAKQLQASPWEVLTSSMRLRVMRTGLYTYSDLVIASAIPRLEDEFHDSLLNPKLIVEVFSKATEAYDRGRKFAQYRRIDSLEEFVLVSQYDFCVEVFTRLENNQWLLSEAHGRHANILLRSIDCTLKLSDIYQRVEIPESGQDRPHE